MSFYWLFGTFHVFAIAAGALSPSSFEPSSSNSSFSSSLTERWLAAADAGLCQCTGALSPLKPELKKTHVDYYYYYYILLHPVARRRLLLRAGGGGWKGGYFKHGRWGEGSSKREQEGKRNCYTELKLRVC